MEIPEYTFSNIEDLKKYVVVNGKALDEGGLKAQYHAVHRVPTSVLMKSIEPVSPALASVMSTTKIT